MKLAARFSLYLLLFFSLAAAARPASAQDRKTPPSPQSNGMSGMDMSKPGDMKQESQSNPDAARQADAAMSMGHMEMNPHMHMTALRPANPADQARANELLATLRQSIEKYRDYHVALADGYQIFHSKLPQPHYHFTNYRNAFAAGFAFDPARPTSLLYRKTPGGYELEGAMFTAPRRFTEDQLNERVPLSVARWHQHVNLCMPPQGARVAQVNWKQFGFGGSIADEQTCNAAGGRWVPVIFGWMVHVYPFESDPAKIWAH